jgi:primary-amine oxidase
LSEDALQAAQRPRIQPPLEEHNFLPDLIAQQPNFNPGLRPEIKPLHILQPEGVGFTINGNEIEWQKWKFHAG